MRRKLVLILSLVVYLGAAMLSLPLAAQKGGKKDKGKGTEIPVVVTFENRLGHRLLSDGGSYVHEQGQVKAVIQANIGNLVLDTGELRKLAFDFAGCGAALDPCPPLSVSFQTDALLTTLGGSLLEIVEGESRRRKLQVSFSDPTGEPLKWTFRFAEPDMEDDPCHGSSTVTVTRGRGDTWVIEASPGDLACLVSIPTKGRRIATNRGFYSMPFKLTIVPR